MEPRKTTLPTDSAERKAIPLYRGLVRYCPAALAAVAQVSQVGGDKHCGGELYHDRGKSTDHLDAAARHVIDLAEDFGKGVGRDENGVPQLAYAAWRHLMALQEWLEKHDGAPLAPAAKLPPNPLAELAADEVRRLFSGSSTGAPAVQRVPFVVNPLTEAARQAERELGPLLRFERSRCTCPQAGPESRTCRYCRECDAHLAAREKAQANPDGHGQCEPRPTCIADTSCKGCESCAGARAFPERQPCKTDEGSGA